MNIFRTKPVRKDQRNRWLTLLDLVQNQKLTSLEELRGALAERGHPISNHTLTKDLRACNIHKIEGIYTVAPYTTQSVVEEILASRMRVAVTHVFYQGDIVVLNTQKGAAPWLASALREYDNDEVLSFMEGRDTVWVLAAEGKGDRVYGMLAGLFRKART